MEDREAAAVSSVGDEPQQSQPSSDPSSQYHPASVPAAADTPPSLAREEDDDEATSSLLSSRTAGPAAPAGQILPDTTSYYEHDPGSQSGDPYCSNNRSSEAAEPSAPAGAFYTFGDFPHGPTLESGGAIFNTVHRPARDVSWGKAFLVVFALLVVREASWFLRAFLSLRFVLVPELAAAEFLGMAVGLAAAVAALLGTVWAVRHISAGEGGGWASEGARWRMAE